MSESMLAIHVGRLLRANATGFVLGCRVSETDEVSFGSLVRVDTRDCQLAVFGLIHDISVADDLMVRQLAISAGMTEEQRQDQLQRRQVPIEMSVLAAGYREHGIIHRRIPPRPPLSLDQVVLCSNEEIRAFTEKLGHFRLILHHRMSDIPVEQLLVAHIAQAYVARGYDHEWALAAAEELIAQLRDDHGRLLPILEALGDEMPDLDIIDQVKVNP